MSSATPLDLSSVERDRLHRLIPKDWQRSLSLQTMASARSGPIRVMEQRVDQFVVEIYPPQWEALTLDQRNLLFWHQIARIQAQTVPREGWERSALFLGLGGAVGELWVQDTVLLLISLGLVGVAAYRLYRRRRDPQRFQVAIEADQAAIKMATQFGYSSTLALTSLVTALQGLMDQTKSESARSLYRARLEKLRR